MEILHIYGQAQWHDEVFIAGTRWSLERLRMTIDLALKDSHGQMGSFTNDGEGYRACVVLMSDDQAAAMPVPYSDDMAREPESAERIGPWTIMLSNGK